MLFDYVVTTYGAFYRGWGNARHMSTDGHDTALYTFYQNAYDRKKQVFYILDVLSNRIDYIYKIAQHTQKQNRDRAIGNNYCSTKLEHCDLHTYRSSVVKMC